MNPVYRYLRQTAAVLLALSYAASISAKDEGKPYYDEVHTKGGKVRSKYSEVYPIYQNLSEEEKATIRAQTLKDFQGDNTLEALPRLLTKAEFNELEKGVAQRGKALRLFLQDYYSGKNTFLNTVIPKPVFERIVERANETPYRGLVNPDSLAFPYGPDVMRDPNGVWRVVEDNIGFIGGPGDLIRARETLMKRMPEYQDVIRAADQPEEFYRTLVERYKSLRNPPDGKLVLFLMPPYPDNEDLRLKKIFADLGVDIVTPYTKKKLTFTADGAFVDGKRVGYMIMGAEYPHADFTHPAAYEKALIDEAKGHLDEKGLRQEVRAAISEALQPDPVTGKIDHSRLEQAIKLSPFENELLRERRKQAKGLTDAILSGKVASNYSPGIDFPGDKEFYVYLEDLIRHYLNEEPILRNIPTERFGIQKPDGSVAVNQELIDRVFKNREKYVVKAVDGRGGDAVWVGPNTSPKEFNAAKKKVLAEPERYIVQEFTHLSVMDGKIVDLRMISAVDSKGVLVSKTPWGRALPLGGDGKVNISSQGGEVAVIVTDSSSKRVRTPKAGVQDCLGDVVNGLIH